MYPAAKQNWYSELMGRNGGILEGMKSTEEIAWVMLISLWRLHMKVDDRCANGNGVHER